MTCLNCGHDHNYPYCPQCAQPSGVVRLTLKGAITEFQQRFIGLDNLFMRTFWHLWVNPGKVVSTFLNGNRRRYLGGIAYLLLMLSLVLIIFEMVGVDANGFYNELSKSVNGDQWSAERKEMQYKINAFANEHLRLINFSLLPAFALMSMLFFRKEALNFTEHIVFFAYVQAQPIWLNMFLGLLYEWSDINLAWTSIWISFGYAVWVSVSFFKSGNPIIVAIKAVLIQFLVMLLIGLLGGIVGVLYLRAGS